MRVDVSGLDDAIEGLDAMSERIQDLSPALSKIGDDLEEHMRERFDSRTAPDGSAWAPLSEHTLRYRKGGNGLRDTVFARVEGERVVYGSTAPFAAVHQEGSDHVPARPFAPTGSDNDGPAGELLDEARQTLVHHVIGR